MSLIRKHVAVLQAWACLALVPKMFCVYRTVSWHCQLDRECCRALLNAVLV